MRRQRFVEWAGSFLAALSLAVAISVLGAPTWAAFACLMLGFWTLRGPVRK